MSNLNQSIDDAIAPSGDDDLQARQEEFVYLKQQLTDFMQQDPKSHVLYGHVLQMIPQGQSLDFYRGFYSSLTTTLRAINASRKAAIEQLRNQEGLPESTEEDNNEEQITKTEFEPLWQATFQDVLKLQTGVAISRMLYTWPDEWMPPNEEAE